MCPNLKFHFKVTQIDLNAPGKRTHVDLTVPGKASGSGDNPISPSPSISSEGSEEHVQEKGFIDVDFNFEVKNTKF